MQLIYIMIMPFLLTNGPNSNKVEKGHILPLRMDFFFKFFSVGEMGRS